MSSPRLPFNFQSLTLGQKGLILVGVPLLFELLFVIMLGILLHQAERETERVAHSRAIITKTGTLSNLFIQSGGALASFSVHKSELHSRHYEVAVEQIPIEMAELKELCKDNPRQMENLRKIEVSVDKGLSLITQMKENMSDGPSSRLSFFMSGHRLFKELKRLIDVLELDLTNFVEEERRVGKINPIMEKRARSLVHMALWAGTALNILLAFFMARLFYNGVTGRLRILTDNSMKLARAEPLNPVIPGSDEVAHLDRVFHEMADALAEAARKERAVIENMPAGLVILDQQGIITQVNTQMERLFEFKKEDLLSQHMSLLFPGVEEFSLDDFSSGAQEKLVGKVREFSAHKKNGTVFPAELSVIRFNTNEGDRLLVNILDVTDRHVMEKLRREFVSTVSHELRTPLTSIRGSLTLLCAGALGPLSEPISKVVKIAERNSIRLINLINDLLDIEKLEAGKMDMVFGKVELLSVLERAMESVHAFADQHGVKVELEAQPLEVYADADRLVQVLVNLLSNACKYSPAGGSVKLSVQDSDNYALISVCDQGRGIPEEAKNQLFERFQQVENEDATKKGGTGLGLAICKAIIEQHNGTIGVDSTLGKGSTFWFKLPKWKEQTLPVSTPRKPAETHLKLQRLIKNQDDSAKASGQ